MKNAMALTLAGLLAAPSLGFAAAPDAVMVFARQGDKGSVSVGDKHFRTQAFKVRLVNAAKSEISLKNSCLVALSAAGQSFRLDTVDEELTAETLKPGASVEGDAIFASEDDAVYGASLVRLSDRCKPGLGECRHRSRLRPSEALDPQGTPGPSPACGRGLTTTVHGLSSM
ncbi:TPA: DUF4354 family protein [Pseudomonas aeruginosa]|nr:DUF4354 family protein [Pseudomonas aeruginosa]